ncbi:MAG TPA: hypothetical protein VE359_02210 [Vicinamibacteria bacterium]|nr:hypothetical protein [Vicinamibacteria bacterium]
MLDADATTSRAFPGRVVGVYRRSGPNSWDEYVLVDEDGGPIEVLAGIPIQVDTDGATFRMRRKGVVIRVAWTPDDGGSAAGDDLRTRFLKSCVRDEDPTPEGSLGAWLHGKLDEKPEPHD